MNLGEKIKELRKAKKMTLEELGDAVGVGKSTVRKWETGMIANMKRDKIAKLANALGVSPSYLMGWDDALTDDNAVLLVDLLENETVLRIAGKMKNLNDEQLVTVEAVVDSFIKR